MNCTVKKLAKLSGVTVRTLHFYDEIGLLKPARYGANGYRLYAEEQLLRLQQILFYRELGFDLKRIQKMLGQKDFDVIDALTSHRKALRRDMERTEKLIQTIDKTIAHLKGTKKMKNQELFQGFDAKKQAEHEKYLIDRFGEPMKKSIAASYRKVKDWTKADWEAKGWEFAVICQDLTKLMEQGLEAGAPDVQKAIRRHYMWLRNFWKPNRESYTGHSQLILTSDLRKAYDAYHPRLADFLAEGIKLFAQRDLT